MSEIERGVQHSISTIRRSVEAYVFERDDSAYRVVAVELRKLLLDTNAAASFAPKSRGNKNKRSLFELHYGRGKNILVRSFMPDTEDQKRSESEDYMAVSPSIYKSRIDILCGATSGSRLVALPIWLDEPFVHNDDGAVLKVRTVLQDIADKEGAHIIRLAGRDKREDVRVAFAPGPVSGEDIASLDYVEHWEQFVIDAGMRLLDARSSTNGHPLIAHGIDVPDRKVQTTKVEKIRPGLVN
ncbi:MAG: hypothetical protein F4X72_05060 [Dehalococcoidia bacterium]|nr:hypothetical protein [Dehalococcoidia bacterium]